MTFELTTTHQRSANTYDLLVNANLRKMREHCGLSQTKVGEIIGLTFQQIQKYEKGSNRISAGRVALLAEYYGVNAGEFFKPDFDPTKAQVNAHAQFDGAEEFL